MPMDNPNINLEFNAHFLDTALAAGQRLVECPITFHPRVGSARAEIPVISAHYGLGSE